MIDCIRGEMNGSRRTDKKIQKNASHLDSEYDDTFCQGMERAIQIFTGFFDGTIQIKRNKDEREVQEAE